MSDAQVAEQHGGALHIESIDEMLSLWSSPLQMLLFFVFVVATTAVARLLVLRKRNTYSARQTLPHLSYRSDLLNADEEEALWSDAYEKYLRNGQAFTLDDPLKERRPQYVLSPKYLDEIGSNKDLSFSLHCEETYYMRYTGAPIPKGEDILQTLMSGKVLTGFVPSMAEERTLAFQKTMPPCKEWTNLMPYPVLARIIVQTGARVMVGAELCRNEEWLQIALEVAQATMIAGTVVRTKWHPYLRWASRWFSPEVKAMRSLNDRGADLLRPEIQRRLAVGKDTHRNEDSIDWCINSFSKKGYSLNEITKKTVEFQLFFALGSIHNTTSQLLSIWYDLMDHPDSLEEIRDEIEEVRKQYPSWTREALQKLWKMDSFMKESSRINPLGIAGIIRSVTAPVTFKDGLHLPKGAHMVVPLKAVQLDPRNYRDPLVFDPHRYLRMRQTVDPNRFHFAAISEDCLGFGIGMRACSGRALGTDEIKLMLITLCTKYEWKHVREDQKRPPPMPSDVLGTFPNVTIPILIRERQALV